MRWRGRSPARLAGETCLARRRYYALVETAADLCELLLKNGLRAFTARARRFQSANVSPIPRVPSRIKGKRKRIDSEARKTQMAGILNAARKPRRRSAKTSGYEYQAVFQERPQGSLEFQNPGEDSILTGATADLLGSKILTPPRGFWYA